VTEGDVLLINLAGVATPVRLLAKVMVWGVPYWSCLWSDVPAMLSEDTLQGKALNEWQNIPYGEAND
jgi:hypothetical protein